MSATPTRRLVAVLPPPVTLWAVYCHPEHSGKDAELSVTPVLLLNVYEERCPNRQGEPDTVTAEIFPVVLTGGALFEEDGLTENFLGLNEAGVLNLRPGDEGSQPTRGPDRSRRWGRDFRRQR